MRVVKRGFIYYFVLNINNGFLTCSPSILAVPDGESVHHTLMEMYWLKYEKNQHYVSFTEDQVEKVDATEY